MSVIRQKRGTSAQPPCAQITRDGGLIYHAWETQLPVKDPKREFLLTGIKQGFHILDASQITAPVEMSN